MKSYVLVQAVRRVKPKKRNKYIHSNITRIETYDLSRSMAESMRLQRHAIDKWKAILGDRWLVIAAEVDQESASEVLSDLEVHCD